MPIEGRVICRHVMLSVCLLTFRVRSISPSSIEGFFCPPPFRRKVEGHCFWFSVGRGSEFFIGTLSPELLPQFLLDPFETLQVF